MEITVRQWIENFNNGMYDGGDFKTQCQAGWFDWFCKDTSLKNKTKRMGNIIKKITHEYILDRMYVFFKNNCPMVGKLYDQFKFCDIESGDVIYCISCDDEREENKYTVFGKENDFVKPLAGFNTTKELVAWLNEK